MIKIYDLEQLDLHDPIELQILDIDEPEPKKRIIQTTVGRVIFNQIVPDEMGFINMEMNKGVLSNLVFDVYRKVGLSRTVELLDDLKEMGFYYATLAGITVSVRDMLIPKRKHDLLESAQKEVESITKDYQQRAITDGERYNKVIDTWTHTTSDVANEMFKALKKSSDGFNPI